MEIVKVLTKNALDSFLKALEKETLIEVIASLTNAYPKKLSRITEFTSDDIGQFGGSVSYHHRDEYGSMTINGRKVWYSDVNGRMLSAWRVTDDIPSVEKEVQLAKLIRKLEITGTLCKRDKAPLFIFGRSC